MTITLIIIFIVTLLSAFFSGMEIAFLTSNKLQIEVEKKQGSRPAQIISKLISRPKEFIATMLIGNNVALVIFGIFMTKILEEPLSRWIEESLWIIVSQSVISSVIILIFAEFAPKVAFRTNSNFFLRLFAFPVYVFYVLFYPFSKASIRVSDFIMKNIFKTKIQDAGNIVFGKVDIDNYLNEMNASGVSDSEDDYELKIFQNALDFSNVKLRECYVPRTEITAAEIDDPIQALKEKFIETGYSKILIYKNNIDNIIGYTHSSELFKKPENISEILHEIIIVPETMPANKLLSMFIQQKRSLAVVVDEFGGTAGMVTIEDIIEEIFGEIEDEHDTDELEEKKISDDEFVFAGRIEIDYLNEKYSFDFPQNLEFETIAGYILYHHKDIPKLNETIVIENISFKILRVTNTRIELVHLKRIV